MPQPSLEVSSHPHSPVKQKVTLLAPVVSTSTLRGGYRSKDLPFSRLVPHSDGAGTIDAVGDGVPGDADFVFDARCLPNPHWDARLRPLSGRDSAVREHLDEQDGVRTHMRGTDLPFGSSLSGVRASTAISVVFGSVTFVHQSLSPFNV